MNQVERMTDIIAKFVGHTAKKLPDDVIAKLSELREKEDSPMAKVIYDTMFRRKTACGSGTCSEVRNEIPAHR